MLPVQIDEIISFKYRKQLETHKEQWRKLSEADYGHRYDNNYRLTYVYINNVLEDGCYYHFKMDFETDDDIWQTKYEEDAPSKEVKKLR